MRVVICSGYVNPLHSGHVKYLEEASRLGDYLVMIVNSDKQVEIKGSTPFMNQDERVYIVQALRCVDLAVISKSQDGTVCSDLELIHSESIKHFENGKASLVFAKGGDRIKGNVPEEQICEKLGIEIVYGVGGEKITSSSELLEKVKHDT